MKRVRIKHVLREDFDGIVYNFHCLPDENYFSEGVLVHNCYKSNSADKPNQTMSAKVFKTILDKFPPSLCQIAFGITDLQNTPDLWEIMQYTRSKGIIPNITINGQNLTSTEVLRLVNLCGSVAVSRYSNTDICYEAVHQLTTAMKTEGTTLKQVNIHQILHQDFLPSIYQLFEDYRTDERLKDLNAVVFLLLKPKGERNNLQPLQEPDIFIQLLERAEEVGLTIGMDSCSAPLVLKAAEKLDKPELIQSILPCESGLESIYLDVNGLVFPCSFCPGDIDFEPIDMTKVSDFKKDVWYAPQIIKWREKLINSSSKCNCSLSKYCRSCPVFDISACKEK